MISPKMENMPQEVDLVIVGAGPAGLMAAAWAAVYHTKTLLIDKRAHMIQTGHADGLQSRTLEILHSFDFGDRIYKEANRLQEVCFWNPDEHGRIRRTDRIPDTIPGISRFQQSVIHQGRIEHHFFNFIERTSQEVVVRRPIEPVCLELDESLVNDDDAFPITITLPPSAADQVNGVGSIGPEVSTKDVRCKYLIGCDGAHSWVRKQVGLVMEGEQTESVWGVMDIIPITNFPDIRARCAIHSASSGSIMVIPRERGLVRLYIQLANIRPAQGERFERSNATPAMIFDAAQKILDPYQIKYEYCEWWTIYQIGQKVANGFSVSDRIFLAGDAVHTHSPKAGQGMNVSMHDAYNLGWKIGSVIKKTANRCILSTYEVERKTIAHQLIDFDRSFSRMFSGRPARDLADEAGISMSEFKRTFETGNRFTSGLSIRYQENMLIARDQALGLETDRHLNLGGLEVGMRFPSFQVVSQCDATPVQLGDMLKSNGKWRLMVFGGDVIASPSSTLQRLKDLGKRLETPNSPLNTATVEPILVHASPRRDLELFDVPRAFYCRAEAEEFDYYRIFADDMSYHHGHGRAYEGYGVKKEEGLLVLVRPDQYISWVGSVDDTRGVENFLAKILRY